MNKKVFIKTFGCQMNEYDSNRIYDTIKKVGFIKTLDQKNADCYILNTCHIRDKAKEKVYHEIGRVKKSYKKKIKPILIVAGCVAQAENQEMIKREPYIDAIIGPQSYHKINEILKNIQYKKKYEETEFDVVSKFDFFDKFDNSDKKISSFLTIQEGCDKFCNFCVVPFTRGPEFSRPVEKILKEAKNLINNGVREIILLGQNVNAYSFEKDSKVFKLSYLLNELEKLDKLKRIRYTTSHPMDMTDDLINAHKDNKKVMPFIHLPIQSGSDRVLKLMNRKHKVKDYLKIYEKLLKIRPDIKLSSDFIVGYPGETEQDFQDTIHLVKKIKFINSFSFIFSPRPGTKSSNLELINESIAKDRLIKLQTILSNHQIDMKKKLLNSDVEVLVENQMKNETHLFGRDTYFNPVIFKGDKNIIGKFVKVKILRYNQNTLFGEIEKNNMKAA